MTDRTDARDPEGHLDAELLADLQEGLLDQGTVASAQEHLAGCPACTADLRLLADIPGRLAAVGAAPLPGDVAERLEEALAAQSPLGDSGHPGGSQVRRLQRPAQPPGMRVLQAAAVLVLVLAGVGIVVTAGGGGEGATDSAGQVAEKNAPQAASEAGAYPVTASGRSWDETSVVAAVPELVAGALDLGPAPAQDATPSSPALGSPGDSSARQRRLASTPAGRLAEGPALAECVGRINLGPVTPLSVDIAQWKGQPAAVIVLPTPQDPATVDVYVVEPACPEGSFLFFARVARP